MFSYDDSFKYFKGYDIESMKPCTFFEQSTCVSNLHNDFDEAEFIHDCLPACSHSTIYHKEVGVRY